MAVGAGGDNLEDDNTEVNSKFIYTFVIIEGLIVLGSLAAAVLHFHAAGKRLSKVAHFHLTHLAFCTWFFAFDFTYAVNEATYNIHAIHRWCSRFQFSEFIGVDLLFLVAWRTFKRYWESVLAKRASRELDAAEVRAGSICSNPNTRHHVNYYVQSGLQIL